MRVINVSLSELETKVLMIGFQDENEITQVRIDAAEILTDYPNATPTLIAKPLFGFAYPVIVTKEGTDIVWEIDNSVLSFHGDGEIQLTFTQGTVIAKSYVGRIRIKRSLAVTGEAPDPIETWEQAATAKLAEVDAQIGELEGMVDTATDAATRAEQSASTASTKAEQATEAAQTATEKAGDASASATAAQTSATDAASSATAASASETAAKASETAAGASATQAGTSAQTANTAAQTATQKAAEATQSATDAETFAGTATTKAEEAAESAQAAQDVLDSIPSDYSSLDAQVTSLSDDIASLYNFAGKVYPTIRLTNDFVNGSRYLIGGFANAENYCRSRFAYPAGKYGVEAINPGWVAVAYVSDSEGTAIISSWTASKTTFTANSPFYITFNGVTSTEVFNSIVANFVINQVLDESGETLSEQVADLADDLQGASADIDSLDDKVDSIIVNYASENVFNGQWVVGETVKQADGTFIENASYARSDYIPIKAGKVNIGIKFTTTIPQVVVNYCVYNANKEKVTFGNGNALEITASGDMQYSQITVENDGYIVLVIYQQNSRVQYFVTCGEPPVAYVDYYTPKRYLNPDLIVPTVSSMIYGVTPGQVKKDSLDDGETMTVESNSILNNYEISFFAKVTTFDELYIGHGKTAYGYYIKIDNTNITYCSNGTEGTAVAHDLTIAEYIGVIIKISAIGTPTIIVNTFGGTKTDSHGTWTGRKDEVFAMSDGSALTDAVLTWNSDYYKKAIWAFGDSYFANNTNLRWPYYIIYPWGFDNMLLNAYPGEGSLSAYNDLITALKHGTPKYLLWCMGMNDSDTGSAANADWLNVIERVKTICTFNNITLIMATIPEVTASGYSNAYKNAYVAASGYRYIDFAGAVDGVSDWLYDGVHPNANGAQLLAAKAIADCPEIMQA